MTLEHVVASAKRLRELRQLAEAPRLRLRLAASRRAARQALWRDLGVAALVLAAGWMVGGAACSMM